MKHDAISTRMKTKYEDVFRQTIPQRTYALLRIDGKAFHTFTKGLPTPFSQDLADALDHAALELCKVMQGCRLAYGQSDEYSFLFTDFEDIDTEMWFKGNVQKITSVAASIFTAHFNAKWQEIVQDGRVFVDKCSLPRANDPDKKKKFIDKLAMFDARVFIIPGRTDVINYFVWRQQDASRNSLSMLASTYFSAKELHGKKAADMHEMLHRKGQNWNNWDISFKRGRVIKRIKTTRIAKFVHKSSGKTLERPVHETPWAVDNDIPVFTQDHDYLDELVPLYELSAKAGAAASAEE